MGVTYKLRPEVKEFIIEQKKNNPALSCRSLTALVGQKFQFHISKSSINAIFKEAGLSMPVGRRSKTKKAKPKSAATQLPPEPKLLTAQTPQTPQLPQRELPAQEQAPLVAAKEEPVIIPAPAPEEIKQEDVFKELTPKISLTIPAQVSGVEEAKPELIDFQPMKEPAPETEPQAQAEPAKETASASEIREPFAKEPPPEGTPATGQPEEKSAPEEPQVAQPMPGVTEPTVETPPEPVRGPIDRATIEQPTLEKKPAAEPEPAQTAQPPQEKLVPEEIPPAQPAPETDKQATETPPEPAPVAETTAEQTNVQEKSAQSPKEAEPEKIPAQKPPEEKTIPQQPAAKEEPAVSEPAKPQAKPELACTGAIIFKAVDYLFGGVQSASDKIKLRLEKPEAGLEEKVAAAIYANTFTLAEELAFLAGKQIPLEELHQYVAGLQENKQTSWDMARALLNTLDEVRSMKVSVSDGSSLFIDGQFHSAWNTNQIPYDFNNPLRNTKHYVNKYFYEKSPLVLLMATGTEKPSKEFFNLLLALEGEDKSLTKLTLYGNDGEELEINSFDAPKKRQYLFGLWPGQFIQCRKVIKIDEFKPVTVAAVNKELLAASCQIQLQEPSFPEPVTLSGCAVKYSASEKIKFLVVGNTVKEGMSPPEMLGIYLSRWPQPDYAWQDFSRKVEIFTYTAGTRYLSPALMLGVDKNQQTVEVRKLFDNYLKTLDYYIRRELLPAGYHDKTFSFMREQFYRLPVKIKLNPDHAIAIFYPPQDYRLRTDLVYLCRKLNEREIATPLTKRLWFSL